jgi:hypothetical protein
MWRRTVALALGRRCVTVEADFYTESIHARCVVDAVALGRKFLRVCVFPLSESFRKCCTNHLYLNTAIVRRKSGRSLGILKKSSAASDVVRAMHRAALWHLFSFRRLHHIKTMAELPSHYSPQFGRPRFLSWYEETLFSFPSRLAYLCYTTRLFTGNNFLWLKIEEAWRRLPLSGLRSFLHWSTRQLYRLNTFSCASGDIYFELRSMHQSTQPTAVFRPWSFYCSDIWK